MPIPSSQPAAPAAPMPDGRPRVRLLHHMARSGGTLISKCLGCMDGVVLLSEIHPRGTSFFNPLQQAQAWFGLFPEDEFRELAGRGRIDFADAIGSIADKVEERGAALVIRDWSHLDFTGVPFIRKPDYRLLLAEVLSSRFALAQLCTVRHPIDQWLSLSRLQIMRGHLFLEPFLAGYRRFAEVAAGIGFVRYEDVVAAPDLVLADLCLRLHLPFDPTFQERWSTYAKITGDVGGSRGGREIKPVARRPVAGELLAAFASNADYRAALDLLGYDHPDAGGTLGEAAPQALSGSATVAGASASTAGR